MKSDGRKKYIYIYFVPYGYISTRKTESQVLTILGPCAAIDSPTGFVFLYGFLLGGPKRDIRE